MKRTLLIILGVFTFITLKAQWIDDNTSNTLIATTSSDAGEIYLATNPVTGDTYAQWCQFHSNGWSPALQRITFDGVPQWRPEGIQFETHSFSSMSEGVAIAATTDGGVVSCFAAYDDHTYAVKIDADGNFVWGEQGIQLFDGAGFSRAEVIAGNDGGVWTLGYDYVSLYLQYVNADGTLNPVAYIYDNTGLKCAFGQLTLGNDNNVFVTYEKLGNGMYTDKQIFVAGYAVDGTQISPETQLMSSQSFQSTYIHHALSDGMGGGYVYIWHPGIGASFNTYVFHFNQNGAPTISGTNGVPVHSADPDNFYFDAYATVDPISHDLILAYRQTDSYLQSQSKVYINRITSSGYVMWDEGKLVIDNGTNPCYDIKVDAFQYGEGFVVTYLKQNSPGGTSSIVEAQGFTDKGEPLWTKVMSSNYNWKVGAENTSGFHNGQNIMMWVNAETGGLYGQNIGQNGEMGEITPPIPPAPCDAPTHLQGEYIYNPNTESGAALISWTAPETTPLHYNLYCEETKEVIEIDAAYNSYYDERNPGGYIYRLTAVYEDCESNFAMTETGDNYLLIEVTSIPEDTDETMVSITKVYTLTGQQLRDVTPEALSPGVYILQGLDQKGNLINKKIHIKK